MPLLETSGNNTADGYGGGVAAIPNYIEDVFSTYLYTGNGSTQTITNNIDLSTKGGMVWAKSRSSVDDNRLYTGSAVAGFLKSNATSAATNVSMPTFNTNGFTVQTTPNDVSVTYASWTFRKQPKFFDIVTYTGTGANTTIPHNLGSVPGCIIVKRTDSGSLNGWQVYHRSLANTQYMVLNTTAAVSTGATRWNSTSPTATEFSLGTYADVNASGGTYVAYLFAHDAGGFGLTGTNNVISCGSFTTDASGNATVSLGYEPQWVLVKNTSGFAANWFLYDVMRGMPYGTQNEVLYPNTSGAAQQVISERAYPTATGMEMYSWLTNANYIYIAIRRGPMKVPTDGTKFYDAQYAYSSANTYRNDFTVDAAIQSSLSTAVNRQMYSRLTGSNYLSTNATTAETANASARFDTQTGFNTGVTTPPTYFAHLFRRAPSFFDEVCYTGTGSSPNTQTHNLGVAPELIIVKSRSSAAYNWTVFSSFTGSDFKLQYLNTTAAAGTISYSSTYMPSAPTATQVAFGTTTLANDSAVTYVAYLFATCAGVSKVGSYTGNGSTQTINCGFAGGARFVLIKRTDSTGDWYVYDTARGMTTLTDPYLLLNSTAAQSATLGSVTTVTTGFAVNASILAAINTNGASYIYLSIA